MVASASIKRLKGIRFGADLTVPQGISLSVKQTNKPKNENDVSRNRNPCSKQGSA
jgi:hypothetical protein